MKIKVKQLPYSKVSALKKPKHRNPKVPPMLFRYLMKAAGSGDLKDAGFSYNLVNLDKIPDYPCLILMNHSSFIDLEMAASILYPKPFSIVCTSDGFVGKYWLMRNLGCIPTNKFVTDASLISDISYALKKNKTHVLMYPEASYTFDGRATALPPKFGVILKLLKVPVMMITTHGAFTRDPLYNMLQKRSVKVTADVKLLFTEEELKTRPISEIDRLVNAEFDFDGFAWQRDNGIEITEDFRADGLERILYKCPCCGKEGVLTGKGTAITCKCGAGFEMDTLGRLCASGIETDTPEHLSADGLETETLGRQISADYETETPGRLNSVGIKTDIPGHLSLYGLETDSSGRPEEEGKKDIHFSHIPDWYAWERDEVRREIEDGSYLLEFDCRIIVFRNYKCVYDVGRGHLRHDCTGFTLTGDDGLSFFRSPVASYGLYADYYWYELGDIVCIGDNEMQYYCLPNPEAHIPVAKARLAAEEMYKMLKANIKKTAL